MALREHMEERQAALREALNDDVMDRCRGVLRRTVDVDSLMQRGGRWGLCYNAA